MFSQCFHCRIFASWHLSYRESSMIGPTDAMRIFHDRKSKTNIHSTLQTDCAKDAASTFKICSRSFAVDQTHELRSVAPRCSRVSCSWLAERVKWFSLANVHLRNIKVLLLLCTADDNRSYRNVCNMSFVSFTLAVIFIIRLFSTSAVRVIKVLVKDWHSL